MKDLIKISYLGVLIALMTSCGGSRTSFSGGKKHKLNLVKRDQQELPERVNKRETIVLAQENKRSLKVERKMRRVEKLISKARTEEKKNETVLPAEERMEKKTRRPARFSLAPRKSLASVPASTSLPYDSDEELILLVILAIFIPPLAVFLMYELEMQFWIDLILTLLFWLPGVIYALYLILV